MPVSRKPPPAPLLGPPKRTLHSATIAFHEAGHTVATMVVRGWKSIVFVTVNGPKGFPGYLLGRRRTMGRLSRKSCDYAKRRARADIVILHGATWSHMHFENALSTMRGKPTRYRKEAVLHDIMEALGIAERICRNQEDVERLNDRLGRKARDIIEECWPQVVAIARALLDQGTLSGKDLWNVARSPDRDADPWLAFDDLVLSLKLPKGEAERLRARIAGRRAEGE